MSAVIDLIGYVAATLTTAAFLPQLFRIWATRSAKDVSLTTFVVLTVGVVMWLLYGILLGSLPIVLANAVTLAIALAILALKRRFG